MNAVSSLRFSSFLLLSLVGSINSLAHGRSSSLTGLLRRLSGVASDEPITPPVQVQYTQHLINGHFMASASGKTFKTIDPRTGDMIAEIAEGEAEDVNRAVSAARTAFDEGPWPKMTAYERSRILSRFADLLEQHTVELASLESWDTGKPIEHAAKWDLPLGIRLIRYYAGWPDKIHGLTVPADGPYHVQVLHEPIGVVGIIIPWNFPLMLLMYKIGPALACGNTVVVKPAEQTPLSCLFAAKLLHEAGLPDGVMNVVSGFGPTTGAALASHMDVDKLTFTGSTEIGKHLLAMAAKSNLKPVTLELGGKSPFIVCKDADIDLAVETAHFAVFFNQGQICVSGSRTFVHESIHDEFVAKAKARAMKRVGGDNFRKDVEQGPQVSSVQFEKVLQYIRSGVDSGAKLETGGERIGSKGYYIQPTVFSNVKDDMKIAREEIFGPVQSILKFKDIDEVIRRANDTHYGLAATVFTQDLDTANTIARAIKAGTVCVNCFGAVDAAIPFGGYKMSGQGREKGMHSLMSYLQVKSVVTPLKNPAWL